MSCGVGHRCGSDPEWLWRRLAATAPTTGPLAWEPPYAEGVALKRPKKKKGNELELEDLSIKIIQSEGEREKRLKKINTHSVSFGTISNGII